MSLQGPDIKVSSSLYTADDTNQSKRKSLVGRIFKSKEVQPKQPTEGTNIHQSHQSNLSPEPNSTDAHDEKPRKKSWLKKWQDLTNPKGEFSEEYVMQRTGMTKDELARWLEDPENKKKAKELWPSDLYWSMM